MNEQTTVRALYSKHLSLYPAGARSGMGAAILLLIVCIWGGLMLEEIYCLQGIRCD